MILKSKNNEDLNRDPEPWEIAMPSGSSGGGWYFARSNIPVTHHRGLKLREAKWDPRGIYDAKVNAETNTVLAELRKDMKLVDGLWTPKKLATWYNRESRKPHRLTHIFHAYKVLKKLGAKI